ncbi:MAG: 50S ribosomal protein L18 [Candidatus Paceibacterota bacterium]|jgi:large subunit ribosomal protein L18
MLFTQEKRIRRHKRGRSKIKGTEETPRLSIFRSSNHVYAQLIDDQKGVTLVAVNDSGMKKGAENKEISNKAALAYEVGKAIAEKAIKELKLSKVIFDKSGYDYHGRVKALAQGARDGGLKF